MNIQEATKLAMKEGGFICRKSIHRDYDTRFSVIQPTNSHETCKLVLIRDGAPVSSCRCWNPTADDLTADDWELFKE